MSVSARAAILSRIGVSESDADSDYQAIQRSYQFTGTQEKAACTALFVERLLDYGAGVFRCAQSEIAMTIAHRLLARGSQNLAVPKDLLPEWLPTGFDFVSDHDLTYRQLGSCEGAITGCAAAIADTGTIILDGTSSQGRRALTLLPDYHLCIVFEDQVFETVPEAMHVLSEAMSRPLTFISGPSATADIEMTRIQGVHGPRSMEVILVCAPPR